MAYLQFHECQIRLAGTSSPASRYVLSQDIVYTMTHNIAYRMSQDIADR